MRPPDPNSPPTYEEALQFAREWTQDPAGLVPYRHHGLETAFYGRGFAFLQTISTARGKTDGYVLITTTARGGGLLSEAGVTIDSVIAEHLARAEHNLAAASVNGGPADGPIPNLSTSLPGGQRQRGNITVAMPNEFEGSFGSAATNHTAAESKSSRRTTGTSTA